MNILKRISSALLILIILFSCKNFGNRPPKKDVVASLMDTTVNPGIDFSKYAFGTWLKNNPIPAAYSSWGIGNLVNEDVLEKLKVINEKSMKSDAKMGSNDQKIGDFYASGMDSAGIEKAGISVLKTELQAISNIKNTTDLINVVAHLHTIGIRPLFDMDVYQDQINSEVYALYLTQGGIGMPNRDYYFNTDERTTKIRNDYRNTHLSKMLSLANFDGTKGAKAIYSIEEKLAQKSRKLEELDDPYANYNKYSLAKLNTLTPSINWSDFFSKTGVKNIDTFIVGQPEFFTQLESLMKTTPIEDWKAYLNYRLLIDNAPYLNSVFVDEQFRFFGKTISGKTEKLPRWKRVLNNEEDVMGELLGQQFVKEFFPPKTKKRYEDMVDSIISVFHDRIIALNWMTPITKEKALKKLSTISKKVGYPDTWKDFSDLKIVKGNYVQNMLNGQQWWYNYNISKLGKKVDRNEWEMTPQTYNAYYNPSNNEIVLPAGIFVIPNYKDEDIDDAVALGYAGASTIGHEITHGFDDYGRQYDEKGNLFNWWTPEDEKQFLQRTHLMVEQFSSYVVLDSLHINGESTLGENLADYGGILLGLDALKRTKQYKENKSIAGLTPTQRYFLGYALGWLGHSKRERIANQVLTDVHSPSYLRVNGPFSNIPEFYAAFGIQKGQPMWRPDSLQVKVW
jgi:putative endopeptidase